MCAREKCAHAWVQGSVLSHTPGRAWHLLLSGRETARKQRTTTTTSQLFELYLRKKNARLQMELDLKSTWPTVSWGYSERESVIVILTFCTTTLCRATHESAILAILGTKRTNFTMLGLVASLKMMMAIGLLNFAILQSTPPSENSAIPKFLQFRIQCVVFDESLISLEYEFLLVLQHIEDSQELWLLLCIQGAYTIVLLVCSNLSFANETYCCIVLSANEAHHGWCRSAR